jgi:hypothetical protein
MRGVNIQAAEAARHAEEKGAILLALKHTYASTTTSVRSLWRQLDMMGHSMRPTALEFALRYLSDRGYIKIWRARELPNWRDDRPMDVNGDAIVYTRILPEGLLLIDGEAQADPKVIF